jgi:hypothetical protein
MYSMASSDKTTETIATEGYHVRIDATIAPCSRTGTVFALLPRGGPPASTAVLRTRGVIWQPGEWRRGHFRGTDSPETRLSRA